MEDVVKLLAQFTPASYGIWTIVLMVGGWMAKEYRETRKLSIDDRHARREGYAKQVEGLLVENRALRAEMGQIREEYDHYRKLCQEETDELRLAWHRVSNDFAGLKRAITTGQIAVLDVVPESLVTEAIRTAAERTTEYINKQEGKASD